MFLLPLITVKMMDVFKTLYEIPGMCISVEQAVELDAQKTAQSSFSPDVYRQPVLTEPPIAEPQIRRNSHGSHLGGRVSALSALEIEDEKVVDSGKIV